MIRETKHLSHYQVIILTVCVFERGERVVFDFSHTYVTEYIE